ncbi:molybdopterin converting factor subunit 1 [Persephonella sp. KM09-Lau-8]|uniref:molybdopterin converting factor subunit 1 n=1 Tax=Persephonella sp. KM09-Lau-8 TaxID=1158345 RepID=UPI00049606F3|nr:molybdopterin converting factor subunit 1 [Persephonella sp. KM09-Lau-8]
MRIKVLYFSSVKDKIGLPSEDIELTENSTVNDLVKLLSEKYPQIKDTLQNSMFAVNEEYASTDQKLKEGDTVAIIPPVSGG